MTRGVSPGMAGPSAIGTGVASAAQMKVSTETVHKAHVDSCPGPRRPSGEHGKDGGRVA